MMHRFTRVSMLILFMLLVLPGCANAIPTVMPTLTAAFPTPAQSITATSTIKIANTPPPTQTPLPALPPTESRIPSELYFGLKPPGLVAEIFAPGIVSNPDSSEFSGVFSPDGREYYFYRFSESVQAMLLFSKLVGEAWTAPEQLAFSEGYAAYEPYIGFDNKRLYFAWNHVTPSGEAAIPAYFSVERTQDGWSEPEYAGQGMFLSSSRDGQFYITDMSSRNVNGKTYLAKVTIENGVFTQYEQLSIQDHFGNQAHPCIAPDGSYILFDVNNGNYLFVSFKEADGTWGEAIDLTKHGFDPNAGGAYISPDGKYLFFSLRGDILWVDISVIESLKPQEQ